MIGIIILRLVLNHGIPRFELNLKPMVLEQQLIVEPKKQKQEQEQKREEMTKIGSGKPYHATTITSTRPDKSMLDEEHYTMELMKKEWMRTRTSACLTCSKLLKSVVFQTTKPNEIDLRFLPKCLTTLGLGGLFNEPLFFSNSPTSLLDSFGNLVEPSRTTESSKNPSELQADQVLAVVSKGALPTGSEKTGPQKTSQPKDVDEPFQNLWHVIESRIEIKNGETKRKEEVQKSSHPMIKSKKEKEKEKEKDVKIKSLLPPNLKTLKLGWKYNQPIPSGCLSITLKQLVFSFDRGMSEPDDPSFVVNFMTSFDGFNQPLDLFLCINLTHLTLGPMFNKHLRLPLGMTHLVFDYAFDKPISIHPVVGTSSESLVDPPPSPSSFIIESDKSPISDNPKPSFDVFTKVEKCEKGQNDQNDQNDQKEQKEENEEDEEEEKDEEKEEMDDPILIPRTLTHLTLGSRFNQPIAHLLWQLEKLVCLKLGSCFSHPLHIIPKKENENENENEKENEKENGKEKELLPNLTSLQLGGGFNHMLFSPLSETLTNLVLGDGFNQPLPQKLPQGLKALSLGYSYDLPLPKDLPTSLTKITLGNRFNQPICFLGLTRLTTLVFGMNYRQNITPFSEFLPPSLTDLSLGNWFNSPLKELPPNLVSLKLREQFNQPLPVLPTTLKTLTLGDRFNQPFVAGNFSPALKHLQVGHHFDQPICKNNLPPSLTHLTLGIDFNRPVDDLPPTLTHLVLGYHFRHEISRLPESITHLSFHWRPDGLLDHLPKNLRQLTLNALGGPFFVLDRVPPLPPNLVKFVILHRDRTIITTFS